MNCAQESDHLWWLAVTIGCIANKAKSQLFVGWAERSQATQRTQSAALTIKYHSYIFSPWRCSLSAFVPSYFCLNSTKWHAKKKKKKSGRAFLHLKSTLTSTLITTEMYRTLRSQQTSSTDYTTPLREVIVISIEWRMFIQSNMHRHESLWVDFKAECRTLIYMEICHLDCCPRSCMLKIILWYTSVL